MANIATDLAEHVPCPQREATGGWYIWWLSTEPDAGFEIIDPEGNVECRFLDAEAAATHHLFLMKEYVKQREPVPCPQREATGTSGGYRPTEEQHD